MQTRLILLEGLFFDHEGDLYVQDTSSRLRSLSSVLSDLHGVEVKMSLHHLPPKPPLPHAPGFGCCMWGGHCPHGHVGDTSWLYKQDVQGVLEEGLDGTWSVGTDRLRVDLLVGHLGRLVCFLEGPPNATASVEDLLKEAQMMVELLESLKSGD